ncbi:NPCBM/NEW2 domain-containing protein [Deinococcus sp.]|uniref:NPCBM/NEW2 domain-containing protein n=1 Tax=Deinococcus sp. TaxID=47478 RepID=UPI003B5CB5D7
MEEFRRSTVHPAKRGRSLGWLTLAVPLLFACGQNANVPVNPDPYAGGVTHPWVYTAPEGQISTQSLTADVNTLSFEKLLSAKNGWGPIERDRSNGEQAAGDGKTLTLHGTTYTRGFGVHAGSEMRFSLKGTGGASCKRFAATVGIDDEVGNRGTAVFQVYLDGVKAFESGVLYGGGFSQRVNLDVTGKKELRLVVTDAGDGISYDHADWANPQLDCSANPSGTLDPSFGQGGIVNIGGIDTAIEPDGSLLYASGENGQFVITRTSPNRQFATNRIALSSTPSASARGLLRQTDGKIVVVGGGDNEAVLVRFNADLSVDTSFGKSGVVTTTAPSPFPYVTGDNVAQQPDGQLLVTGATTTQLPEGEFPATFLARYRPNGQLDPNFGQGGVAVVPILVTNSLAVQPDGRILLGGFSYYPDPQWKIERLLANGTPDVAFGSDGIIADDQGQCLQIVVESNGNILAVGQTGNGRNYRDAVIQRYTPTGARIKKGIVKLGDARDRPFEALTRLLRQPDGRILVSGYGSYDESPSVALLLRFNADLTVDNTFVAGTQVDAIFANNLFQQPDGKLILTNNIQTARYFP